MKRHNVQGMLVGCFLAAFKKGNRGPGLLGLPSEAAVKKRAAEVLGVKPESIKNWMQEFIPYWQSSQRAKDFPGWGPSDLVGRPRGEGMARASRDRMFKRFERVPEGEFTSFCRSVLDLESNPRYGPDFIDELALPYLDKGEQAPVFRPEDMRQKVISGQLPVPRQKPLGNSRPERRRISSEEYGFARDVEIVAWALKRAAGICELCGNPGPFLTADGRRFLEVHHIVPLSERGPDTVENVAALCPNCHRACHHAPDRRLLARKLQATVAMLG